MTVSNSTSNTTETCPEVEVRDADLAAAYGVPQRVVDAWAAQDAGAFAAVFAPDATLILPGVFLKGRDEVCGFMTTAFAGPFKGTRVYGEPIDARFLRPDIAVVVTKGGVLAPGETEVAPERAIRATWVLAKHDQGWCITAYQNTPVGDA